MEQYFKNKYAADDFEDDIKFSIETDKFSQTFIISRKIEFDRTDAKKNQFKILTPLYGLTGSNRKICEEISEKYKQSKIVRKDEQDYLQTFIEIDENTTADFVDKILDEICGVAQKIENKIKMNDETSINKNVIYAYKKPSFSEAKANDMRLLERANWYFDKQTLNPGFQDSFNPIKMMKQSKFDNELNQIGSSCYDSFKEFEEESVDWLPWNLRRSHYFHDRLRIFGTSIVGEKTEFQEKYKSYLKELPFIYENMIQDVNAKEPNAHFLSVDELNKLRESNKIQFLNVDKFEAGQVFIKHPFLPDTYMSIETSETTLFHIKMQCLSRIMQCLGATSVSGHAYVSETKQRNMDADGHVSYKVVDATGSLSTSQNEKYESDYVLEDTFSGDFTEESYAEALEEAKKVGLYNDFDIKNLLEQRNPKKKNEMKSRKVKIEMTRELNKSLDSAFALQAEGFGMNGTYKEILATQRNVMFELNITF